MSRRRAIVAAVMPVMLLTTAQAFGQTATSDATRRPYRGLFGAPASSDSPHSLVLGGSAFVAYGNSSSSRPPGMSSSALWIPGTGPYQGASVGLRYAFAKRGDRFDFRGRLGADLNYYHREDQSAVNLRPSNRADVLYTAQLTRTLSFSAHQSATYSSHYNPSLLSDSEPDFDHAIAIDTDEALDLFRLRSIRTVTSLGVSQGFGRYASLSGSYHFRWVEILGGDDAAGSRFQDYGTQAGSIRFGYSRPLTRHAALNLGYALRASDGHTASGDPRTMHNVNAGVNYSRALSFSRRTTFGFSTGTMIAADERLDTPGTDPRTHVRLIGHARLEHEIGRTWTAHVLYMRGYRTRFGFDQLFFTDAVRARIDGLPTRRLALSAEAAWGDSTAVNRGRGGHRGQSATARAQYALTGFAALYVHYYYYQHRYSTDIDVDPRIPRQLDRQGVRAGVTASVPLIR